jgi:two-component system NtrC family sensor kinase
VIHNDDVRVMLQCRMERQIEITLEDERTYQAQMTLVEGVGYVVVMQDISHLKDLDQIKTNFVASVSQDLRSPLTAIMGYVELLSRAGPVNDLQQMFIDRIALSAQTISDEINDLLDLSRIESSAAETNYEYVRLPMLLDYALATVEGQVAAKQLTLTLDLAKNLPPVWGNAQRLKQMIRNLLENAIMFTPEEGAIFITLKPQSDLLLLKIADTGIGISLEDQPHIFDKFYRAEAVRDEYEGAGLGLAIVKSILDRHDGRIWVESQPGVGSTFSLLLPVGMKPEPQPMKETVEVALAVH